MDFRTFFMMVVEQFHSRGVSYAVMRNASHLPESTNGSDIDFLFTRDDRIIILDIISKTSTSLGCNIIGFDHTEDFCKFSIVSVNEKKNWAVCIDCNFGLNFRGVPYFTSEFEDITIFEKGFRKLKWEWEIIFSILKELLHNDSIDESLKIQFKRISFKEHEKEIKVKFKDQPIFIRLLYDIDINFSKNLGKSFTKSFMLRNPFWYVSCKIRYIRDRIVRIINPCGYIISLHGIDGAGKSTIMSLIYPLFNVATHKNTEIIHLRPRLLPALAELKSKIGGSNDSVRKPSKNIPMYSKPNSGYLVSYFRLLYLLTDYLFGYLMKFFVKLRKNNTVLLFDRYYDDIVIDPARFRLCLDQNILRLFNHLVPKSHSKILLTIDPNLAWERKQELHPELGRSLQQRFREEFEASNDVLILDTTNLSEGEAALNVLRYLVDKMDIYHRKRLKVIMTDD